MSTKNKQDGIRSRIKNILSTLSPGFTTYLMYLYNFKRLPDFDNPKDINDCGLMSIKWTPKVRLYAAHSA